MGEGDATVKDPPILPRAVTLTRCDDDAPTQASLVELTPTLAKRRINGAWWTGLGVSRSRRVEEGDHHWDWAGAIGRFRNDRYVRSVAVQTEDEAVQGAMLYRFDARSVLVPDAGAVFVYRLAAAPRNRGWLVQRPAYRGAGTCLLRWAAHHGRLVGFDGRLVLASLPDPRTIRF
jgi:hypothetical protein